MICCLNMHGMLQWLVLVAEAAAAAAMAAVGVKFNTYCQVRHTMGNIQHATHLQLH
jgi:hypothetical protein